MPLIKSFVQNEHGYVSGSFKYSKVRLVYWHLCLEVIVSISTVEFENKVWILISSISTLI